MMAPFGKEDKPETVIAKIRQDILAEIIGTTRSRVGFFLNKFMKLGFLDDDGGFHVHRSLLTIVLHDQVLLLLLISARRQSHAACHVNSSSLSNFDQTAAGLLTILVSDGKIGEDRVRSRRNFWQHYPTQEGKSMNADQLKGKWMQFKGDLKQQWEQVYR